MLREEDGVDRTGGDAEEDLKAEVRESPREPAQDTDLVGATGTAAREDEREIAAGAGDAGRMDGRYGQRVAPAGM